MVLRDDSEFMLVAAWWSEVVEVCSDGQYLRFTMLVPCFSLALCYLDLELVNDEYDENVLSLRR